MKPKLDTSEANCNMTGGTFRKLQERLVAPLLTAPRTALTFPDGRMSKILDHPFILFLVFLLAQWGAAYLGDFFRRWRPLKKDEREDFDTVLTATLTLLALIIGFSFSMAVSRYDQRKNYEEAEANAIGTEYVRADLLPSVYCLR